MPDRLEDALTGLDRPRALDPAFRSLLEVALREAAPRESETERWSIDGPRALPTRFRKRLETSLTRGRWRTGWILKGLAVAAAVMLLASTGVVVAHWVNAPGSGKPAPAIAAPSPRPSSPALRRSTEPALPPPGSLQGFASRGAFLRYVEGEALKLVGPYGIESTSFDAGLATPGAPVASQPSAGGGQPSATVPGAVGLGPAVPQFSTTNIQEEGVDEPDIVKTDGRRLVVLSNQRLWLLSATAGSARVESSLSFPQGMSVFLMHDRVIIFSASPEAPSAAKRITHVLNRPWTKVTVVDISRLSAPKVLSAFEVEGSFVGARLARGVVRLIVQSGALGPPSVPLGRSKGALAAATAGNKRAILRSVVGDWMPHYVVERRGKASITGHVHDWSAVSRPPDKAGVGMVTVLTVDPANPRPDNALSVIGAGEIIYANQQSLYITSGRIDDFFALRGGRRPRNPFTRIHKFDVSDPARARYLGSGQVPGFLLNQFSMSELDGYLRVASTLELPTASRLISQSFVTVLTRRGGRLVRVGSVGDIGKGERIYSVRFIGTKGYVVTFRQIDPLHVIDLRMPTRPRLSGELKVPGYSGYLHPLSETLLLGVGRYADKSGRTGGVEFSLFDVSNPSAPRRVDDKTVGAYGFSSVESDHHSFLYWEPRHLVVVPASISDKTNERSGYSYFVGAVALTISKSGDFGAPVRLTHTGRTNSDRASTEIRRSLVLGSSLLTVSDAGILVNNLTSLRFLAWVPFQT